MFLSIAIRRFCGAQTNSILIFRGGDPIQHMMLMFPLSKIYSPGVNQTMTGAICSHCRRWGAGIFSAFEKIEGP